MEKENNHLAANPIKLVQAGNSSFASRISSKLPKHGKMLAASMALALSASVTTVAAEDNITAKISKIYFQPFVLENNLETNRDNRKPIVVASVNPSDMKSAGNDLVRHSARLAREIVNRQLNGGTLTVNGKAEMSKMRIEIKSDGEEVLALAQKKITSDHELTSFANSAQGVHTIVINTKNNAEFLINPYLEKVDQLGLDREKFANYMHETIFNHELAHLTTEGIMDHPLGVKSVRLNTKEEHFGDILTAAVTGKEMYKKGDDAYVPVMLSALKDARFRTSEEYALHNQEKMNDPAYMRDGYPDRGSLEHNNYFSQLGLSYLEDAHNKGDLKKMLTSSSTKEIIDLAVKLTDVAIDDVGLHHADTQTDYHLDKGDTRKKIDKDFEHYANKALVFNEKPVFGQPMRVDYNASSISVASNHHDNNKLETDNTAMGITGSVKYDNKKKKSKSMSPSM